VSQIVLVRHAKVKIENSLIFSKQLKKWIEKYNNAPIKATEITTRLKILVENAEILLASELLRTSDTLKIFNKKPDYTNKIFNEAELPYSNLAIFKMPAMFWVTLFRIAWLFGYSNNSKSYKEEKKRAEICADKLINFTKQHKNILLVGHGVMNRLIIKALQKRGFIIKEKTGDGNLGYTVMKNFKFNTKSKSNDIR